jgi:hypothetical protein
MWLDGDDAVQFTETYKFSWLCGPQINYFYGT